MPDTILGDKSTAQSLEVGFQGVSSIETPGDTDWWRVFLKAGFRYQIWSEGAGSKNGTLADPYLVIYSSMGTFITYSDDIVTGVNRDSYILFTPNTSDYYYLSAEEYGNNAVGSYRVTVWQDELNSTATAATVAVDSITDLGRIGFQNDFSD